jgi:hypothetical protein
LDLDYPVQPEILGTSTVRKVIRKGFKRLGFSSNLSDTSRLKIRPQLLAKPSILNKFFQRRRPVLVWTEIVGENALARSINPVRWHAFADMIYLDVVEAGELEIVAEVE